ncbi:MAG TPA: DUF3180 domain-containing protein [Streptosporangiaceae bacterium]|jgi:uncharacterized membrane protein YbhN (UPF0104 family)
MNVTRPGTLAGIFVVGAVAGWLATRATFTSLPLLPVTAIPLFGALAIAEVVAARNIRARLTGRRQGKPVAPMAVARLAALAKASSATGAALGGLDAGYLIFTLGEVNKSIPARDAGVAGGTLAAALAVVAAALYLERCCRVPRDPDDRDDDHESKDQWQWHS